MRRIIFDIETKNSFQEVGKRDPAALDLSLICLYDSSSDSYKSFLEHELNSLWPLFENADLLIGYNSKYFDIPILNKYYHGDLGRIAHVDLMEEIQKNLGRRAGLDAIASATLGAGKSANGLDAIRWWKEGAIEKIRKYCLKDVEVTKKIYDYAIKEGCVYYYELGTGKKKRLALDTSEWEMVPAGDGINISLF